MAHPIRAGQDMSSPEAASSSAHLHSDPHLQLHTPGNRAASTAGHGQHCSAQQNTHTGTRRTGMHQLCPACQGGHTHQCKYSGMHAHTHLGETTPMCKSKPGQLQLPSAPPAPCPLHANAPGEELCHGNPQPRSQGPQSRATGHAEPGVCLGNSTTQHRQQYPAVPHAMPALVPVVPALALTCKS